MLLLDVPHHFSTTMNSQYGAPSQAGASSQYGGQSQSGGFPQQGMPMQSGVQSPFASPLPFGSVPPFGAQSPFGGQSPPFGGQPPFGRQSPFGIPPQQGGMQQPINPGPQGHAREEDAWANMSDQELLANADRIRRKWARSMWRQWRAIELTSQNQYMLSAMAEAEFQADPIRHLRADVYDIQLCRVVQRLVRRGADPVQAFDLVDRFGAAVEHF